MCDCYDHQCAHEGCEETIPMHIADFNYPRSAFKCWCATHIKEAPSGAMLFTLVHDQDEDHPSGWKCAVAGPEVGEAGGNCLNLDPFGITEEVKW